MIFANFCGPCESFFGKHQNHETWPWPQLSCTHSLSSPMVPQHQKGPVPSWKHRWEETQWNYIFERGAARCWNVCGGSTGYTEAGSSRHLNAFGYWFVWKSGTINLDRVSMFIISFPFLVAICCHDFGASKSADTPHFLRSQAHHRWQVREPGTRPWLAFNSGMSMTYHFILWVEEIQGLYDLPSRQLFLTQEKAMLESTARGTQLWHTIPKSWQGGTPGRER